MASSLVSTLVLSAFNFPLSPLRPHATSPGFPRAHARVASHSTLTSNHLTQWLQAMDSLRKAGFPASEADSWSIPENAAGAGPWRSSLASSNCRRGMEPETIADASEGLSHHRSRAGIPHQESSPVSE
jgi:hypothetical protein